MGELEQSQENGEGIMVTSDQLTVDSMRPKSLLIVDDEPIILDSFARELTGAGFEVTTAASGEEAVARITRGRFDLVTADLLMPGIDGLQVLRAAKKRDPQTMVIILTGCGGAGTAVDGLRLGADDYLQKPCDTDELILRISNCLYKQELLRKVALYENFVPVCNYSKKTQEMAKDERGKGSWYNLGDTFLKTEERCVYHGSCAECYTEQIKNLASR